MRNILKSFFSIIEYKIYLLLLLYSVLILFIVSPDSYTHDLYSRCDSAWFFMCGKAWMNGLVPYVDFADSKGPLLWLIYGIGYLISPYDYIGVFWLSCLCYSITFFFCYKIGSLLLLSRRKGFIVAIFMAIPYLWHYFHYETRAEDWCHPFVVISFYMLLKMILQFHQCIGKECGFAIGISVMATLLIKWSIAVMLLCVAGSVFLILIYRKQKVAGYLLSFFISALLFASPFVLYLISKDCFKNFIAEYFVNTAKTVSSGGFADVISLYIDEIKQFASVRFLFIIYLLAGLFFYWKHKKLTIFPWLCSLAFVAISIHHDNFGFYITISATFALWFVALVVNYLDFRWTNSQIFIAMLIPLFAGIWNLRHHDNLYFQESETRDSFYKVNYLMSQVENPKIINSGSEYGLGISCNALPGSRYWALQLGATDEMCEERAVSVSKGIPDFLIISTYGQKFEGLRESNYCYYMSCRGETGVKVDIWGRPNLKLPPEKFKVLTKDILFKNRIVFE